MIYLRSSTSTNNDRCGLTLSCDRFSAAYIEDASEELSEDVLMLSKTGHVNLYRYQRVTKSFGDFEQTPLLSSGGIISKLMR